MALGNFVFSEGVVRSFGHIIRKRSEKETANALFWIREWIWKVLPGQAKSSTTVPAGLPGRSILNILYLSYVTHENAQPISLNKSFDVIDIIDFYEHNFSLEPQRFISWLKADKDIAKTVYNEAVKLKASGLYKYLANKRQEYLNEIIKISSPI